eukprot:CAMPEP_0197862670 /NCGR_PEP_ID=MMETSP1438-20131217/39628_1 /TAXON_ID=1461541 /ORGANISM="Pterosperma sp., Strain CCMP1384" /LENGTH=153 /DNA_ID=CAMNT_0043480317 /DNA_START=254 /DNA_END=712 /DNA_ORIENTATION=+
MMTNVAVGSSKPNITRLHPRTSDLTHTANVRSIPRRAATYSALKYRRSVIVRASDDSKEDNNEAKGSNSKSKELNLTNLFRFVKKSAAGRRDGSTETSKNSTAKQSEDGGEEPSENNAKEETQQKEEKTTEEEEDGKFAVRSTVDRIEVEEEK